MSAASRRKIAAAQRARWAKQKGKVIPIKTKRRISPEGLANIRAAAKKRWAKEKQKKAAYLGRYKRAGAEAGWHFLTGSPHEIAVLTHAVGFRYAYNEKAGQFAHASGVMVATPEGRLSHYFYGIEYGPRDLRLALVEASDHKIGNAVDQVLLACFHYDPSSGRYSMTVMTVVRVAGLATVALIAGAVIVMRRRERRGPLPSNAHA